jgi:alkyl sulfatase BDS1-like metallo-beta-lactamase superfamily hydrolase
MPPLPFQESLTVDWTFTDLDERYRMLLANGVLIHFPARPRTAPQTCACGSPSLS